MYTIQYFIDKFEKIPWYKWCSGEQINRWGQRCAFGHITPRSVKRCVYYSSEGISEMEALEAIGIKYFGNPQHREIAAINNGENPMFQQKTAKGRVLAALKWAQQREAEEILSSCLERQEEAINA